MMVAHTVREGYARTFLATWVLAAGDVGDPLRYPGAADRTVQISGTFGGATVTLEGSLDGSNWLPLTDAKGAEIIVTAAALEAITELVMYVRPVVTGGAGTTVTVTLLMRTTL